MAKDRFNSNEDIYFHTEAFSQGIRARQNNFDQLSQNPYEIGSWMYHSFIAGWCDADQSLKENRNVVG